MKRELKNWQILLIMAALLVGVLMVNAAPPKYGNENTLTTADSIPSYKPDSVLQDTDDLRWERQKANGWRNVTGVEKPAEGCAVESWTPTNFTAETCDLIIKSQYNIAQRQIEEEAARQAAEAARKASPIPYDQTILFAPYAGVAIQATNGIAYQPIFDPVSGEWLGVPRTGSPFHPDSSFTNEMISTLATNDAHRTRIKAIKDDLDDVSTAIDAIDQTAFPTNGGQRAVIVALKQAVKNLKQASEKIRKEIK